MPKQLAIREILRQQLSVPLIDVRSEGEYAQGHIPGAISLPLFSNAERAEIGTLYKQQGKQPAILRGLGIVGPKMQYLAEEGLRFAEQGRIAVHCWRGGMRSASVAWLFERVGLTVDTLTGGYKSYRRLCHELFAEPWRMTVIGGKTGSRKTDILKEAAARGMQMVDLEEYANHRGSAFGSIRPGGLLTASASMHSDGLLTPSASMHSDEQLTAGGSTGAGAEDDYWQPTQEQFENQLGYALFGCDIHKPLLVEDESRLIGRLHIPDPFWNRMRATTVFVLDWPLEDRVQYLTRSYDFPLQKIRQSLTAIRKRLGDDRFGRAMLALDEGRMDEVCRITLDYYDRAYGFGLGKRDPATLRVIPGTQALDEILKLQ